ncbi:hypothetical protein [Desulfonatronum sp. SC1]|uniref:hypothetical protein n=1 Tax=Desulfonatronum sp. SC1 TaxID=2109626 RepID=UPI000D2F5C3E|nr:hypothetical protein [Desulfonatronum sp. SC1]PTN38127.1 hypothetical protein C6366_04500 [Desulfonatronum sp. SC1]
MRKVLMVAIGAVVLAAAVLILVWRPGDEQALVDVPPARTVAPEPQAPADSRYVAPLPTLPSDSPFGRDLLDGEPLETPGSPPDPSIAPPDETDDPGVPETQPETRPDTLEGPLEDALEDSLDEPQPTGPTNISGAFFNDLAQRIVAGYHPPKSEFNPQARGRLQFQFSALNRRYGMDLVGLDHQSGSLVQGREEIFRNLLQPEILDNVWALFVPVFEQSLDEALRTARWSFPAASPEERGLTIQEQQEFYRLLSGSAAALAQAVQSYADHQNAPALMERWFQAQTKAYAAHSRYQVAETELLTAQEEAPDDQVRILAERLERDAAAQGIMQAIAAREQARRELLEIFAAGRSRPDLSESELVYLAEWLYRRIHAHPERIQAIRHMADKLRELSLRLNPGS